MQELAAQPPVILLRPAIADFDRDPRHAFRGVRRPKVQLLAHDQTLVGPCPQTAQRALQHPAFHGVRLLFIGGKQHTDGGAFAARRAAPVVSLFGRRGVASGNDFLNAALPEPGRPPGTAQKRVA